MSRENVSLLFLSDVPIILLPEKLSGTLPAVPLLNRRTVVRTRTTPGCSGTERP